VNVHEVRCPRCQRSVAGLVRVRGGSMCVGCYEIHHADVMGEDVPPCPSCGQPAGLASKTAGMSYYHCSECGFRFARKGR